MRGDDNAEQTTLYHLDVAALYNREDLPVPECSGLHVQSIEEIMAHPFHWAHLSERDT